MNVRVFVWDQIKKKVGGEFFDVLLDFRISLFTILNK